MTDAPPPGDVDYAVPTAVPSSRRRERRTPTAPGVLWGGRPRTWLKAGCWAAAAALSLPLVLPLLVDDETGAESPEAAVEQLLQGIADVDPVAIVRAVDPAETDDPQRASDAYDRMSGRLLRQGEVPPADVTAVLAAAEGQVGGGGDLSSIATLAALDLDLADLELAPETATDRDSPTRARVFIVGGDLSVTVDPDRLPDAGSLGTASYTMPLAEGWRRDRRVLLQPYLVTVERDGRWYVSLEATADDLLPDRR